MFDSRDGRWSPTIVMQRHILDVWAKTYFLVALLLDSTTCQLKRGATV